MGTTRIGVLGIVALLILAGCAGGGGGNGDGGAATATPTTEATGGDGDATTADDAGDGGGAGADDGDGDTGADPEIDPDDSPLPILDVGERYVYESTATVDGETVTRTVTVTVDDADPDNPLNPTITVTVTEGGEELGSVTQNPMNAAREVFFATDSVALLDLMTARRLTVNSFAAPDADGIEEVGDLAAAAGAEWSVQDQLFSLDRTRTVAGQECTVVRTDREEPWDTRSVITDGYSYGEDVDRVETCLAAGIGLPLYHAQYGEDGVLLEVELVSYESG
jgi:hypothetical protein